MDSLIRELQEFMAETSDAVVIEAGEVIFDFANARYSISAEHGKCVLHLWSPERNAVRRVLESERRDGTLRLTVQRFGQAKPSRLEICRQHDRRTPTAKKAARASYERLLRRVLQRKSPECKLERFRTAADLEHSFGPVYTRGVLRRGNSAWAVLGVNAQESQGAIDGALTFGVLWMEAGRQSGWRNTVVEGLMLCLPVGASSLVRQRMAHLNREAAKFRLCELEERDGELMEIDCGDRGNIATRLVRCPDAVQLRERFASSTARVLAVVPSADVMPLSTTEIGFRIFGLEFARARLAPGPGFRNVEEVVFGAGACEVRLSDETADHFADWAAQVAQARHPQGLRESPLWRAQPERWLEALLARDVSAIDSRLDPACVYSQVPAFSASDRAMIDLLSMTREGRLAVLELKADEDVHLPLQGLDYWARVEWHRARGEFERFGYFPGQVIAAQPPLLLLVAPALHVHPATDTLLRYLSPEIDCELVGIAEQWRHEMRVIFRKRARVAGAKSG